MEICVEKLAEDIFGCKIDKQLNIVRPNPWSYHGGSRDEWAKVYSWTSENGFVDITESDDIPKKYTQVAAQSGADPELLPNFKIDELNLPCGVYLILLYQESGSWEDIEWSSLVGRVIYQLE